MLAEGKGVAGDCESEGACETQIIFQKKTITSSPGRYPRKALTGSSIDGVRDVDERGAGHAYGAGACTRQPQTCVSARSQQQARPVCRWHYYLGCGMSWHQQPRLKEGELN